MVKIRKKIKKISTMKILKILISSAVLLTLIFFVSFDPKMFFLNKNRQSESTQNTSEIKSGIPTINPSREASSSNKLHFKACVDYRIVVEQGEGATIIARQAVNEYINEVTRMRIDNVFLPLSSQEKIYAEDYITKHFSMENLKWGDQIVIPCSLVEEAFAKAKSLTINDKRNLDQFKIPGVEYYEAGWIRVEGDFKNSTCVEFCRSKEKVCSPLGCEPDPWCDAKGGMMEIVAGNGPGGINCQRKWEGQCQVLIDKIPAYSNFHCCCK